MNVLVKLTAATFLCLAAATPAGAQSPQTRILAVPATAIWQHADTGFRLPPLAAGMVRAEIRDNGSDELDVSARYEDRAEGVVATVYLYRTMLPDVPLWFDRALTAIRLQPDYHLASTPLPQVTPFSRPGARLASGLRAAMAVTDAEMSSTALAIAPIDHFLVKVRISAAHLDPAALDARLTRLLGDLHWPDPVTSETAAAPVADCANPLQLRDANIVHDDMGQLLLSATIAGMVEERAAPARVFCREPGVTQSSGVYRANASTDAYVIALGDSGTALSVAPALDIPEISGNRGGSSRWSMLLLDRDSTGVLSSFNRLPPPAQAFAIWATGGGPSVVISRRH